MYKKNSLCIFVLCVVSIFATPDDDLKVQACALRKQIAFLFRECVDYPANFSPASMRFCVLSQEDIENIKNMFDEFEAFVEKQISMPDEQKHFINQIKELRCGFMKTLDAAGCFAYDEWHSKSKSIPDDVIGWYHRKCLDILKTILIFHG